MAFEYLGDVYKHLYSTGPAEARTRLVYNQTKGRIETQVDIGGLGNWYIVDAEPSFKHKDNFITPINLTGVIGSVLSDVPWEGVEDVPGARVLPSPAIGGGIRFTTAGPGQLGIIGTNVLGTATNNFAFDREPHTCIQLEYVGAGPWPASFFAGFMDVFPGVVDYLFVFKDQADVIQVVYSGPGGANVAVLGPAPAGLYAWAFRFSDGGTAVDLLFDGVVIWSATQATDPAYPDPTTPLFILSGIATDGAGGAASVDLAHYQTIMDCPPGFP